MQYMIRYGEIGLKGKNRDYFEKKLISNIELAAKKFDVKVERIRGRIFVKSNSADEEGILKALGRVFGIEGICPVTECDRDLDDIKKTAGQLAAKWQGQLPTFRVDTNRADKTYKYISPEVSSMVGEYLLDKFSHAKVDLHNPDYILKIEIRDTAYLYDEELKGPGGLPLGTSGKGVLLLSGGIDSPVAGWLSMKRGLNTFPIYFHSPPFTSELAKQKVIDIVKKLNLYSPVLRLKVVNFTSIQEQILEHCPKSMTTIIMRRMMMRIAEMYSEEIGGKALITGESLGQVASQTIESLYCTNAVCKSPVLRPLITYDKVEIVNRAKKIDTFDISILPYEDCCSMFVPAKPVIHPKLSECKKAEEKLEWDDLLKVALDTAETIDFMAD